MIQEKGGHPAHVRAGLARQFPLGDDGTGGERQHRNCPFAAVGDVQAFRVAAGVEAVRAVSGGQEGRRGERVAVDDPDAAGLHVGDVPGPPAGEILMSWSMACPGRCSRPMMLCRAVSTLSRSPENSQVTMKYRPSGEKSAWFTPAQPTGRTWRTAMVCGSPKTICRRVSAITTAYRPSGVKYTLYGSSTGTGLPNVPVAGLIGVNEFPVLLLIPSVRRSQDGTTCCGPLPTRTVRSIR